jgi:ribosomal protein S12 methylthiotransferase accessory factor
VTQTELREQDRLAVLDGDNGELLLPASLGRVIGDRLAELVSPFGLISEVRRLQSPPGEPGMPVFAAALGNLDLALSDRRPAPVPPPVAMTGTGSSVEQAEARWLSLAECLERYSACVHTSEQFIWATAAELGSDALDLDICPRVSQAEAASPYCRAIAPDKGAAIRWVRGVSLMTGRQIWVPAVMAYLRLAPATTGERFTLPVSTGCAAHSDLRQALIAATCEVVERDAMALTWLQRLRLPRIEIGDAAGDLPAYRRFADNPHIRTYLFDASTDIGISTVYGMQITPAHPQLHTVVTAASNPNPRHAVEKVMRELAACRIGLLLTEPTETDPDKFQGVFDGACYMGRPDRASAFEFLTDDRDRVHLAKLASCAAGSTAQTLSLLLGKLNRAGHEAFAVDLTTDESERAGLWVVRVLVPTLQPLTFAPRTQFRAHPRLYDAPAAMGHPVQAEADLNPWPQPAA